MTLKKIFVSRAVVDLNDERNETDDVFKVECGGSEYHSNGLIILGPSETHYDPTQPHGRRVWIETTEVVLLERGGQTVAIR